MVSDGYGSVILMELLYWQKKKTRVSTLNIKCQELGNKFLSKINLTVYAPSLSSSLALTHPCGLHRTKKINSIRQHIVFLFLVIVSSTSRQSNNCSLIYIFSVFRITTQFSRNLPISITRYSIFLLWFLLSCTTDSDRESPNLLSLHVQKQFPYAWN